PAFGPLTGPPGVPKPDVSIGAPAGAGGAPRRESPRGAPPTLGVLVVVGSPTSTVPVGPGAPAGLGAALSAPPPRHPPHCCFAGGAWVNVTYAKTARKAAAIAMKAYASGCIAVRRRPGTRSGIDAGARGPDAKGEIGAIGSAASCGPSSETTGAKGDPAK